MKNQLIQPRDNFINYIDKKLSNLGFKKDPDKEIWNNEHDVQSPGQTVIINGQRQDYSPETKHIKFQVEIFGNGDMKDINKEITESFVEVDFNIFEEDILISDMPTFCMFFDDTILFDSLINKIFKL